MDNVNSLAAAALMSRRLSVVYGLIALMAMLAAAGCQIVAPAVDDGNRLVFWGFGSVEIARLRDMRAETVRVIKPPQIENIIDVTTAGNVLILVSIDMSKQGTIGSPVTLINVASGNPLQTLVGPEGVVFGAAISPDGQRTAFSVCRAGPVCRIDVQNIDGKERSTVAQEVERHSPVSWSPDGESIAYSDNTGHVAVVNLATGKRIVLAMGTEPGWPTDPDWSPDGRFIVYQTKKQVRILDLTDMTDRAIHTQSDDEDYLVAAFPRWSPDGNAISFNAPGKFLSGLRSCKIYSLATGAVSIVRGRSDKFCGPWFKATSS